MNLNQRICTDCKERKPIIEFPEHINKHKLSDGSIAEYKVRRKKCHNCLTKQTLAARNKRFKTPEELRLYRLKVTRKSNLKRLYGLTEEDFESMLEAQNHKCKICNNNIYRNAKSRKQKTCIDHCHTSGKVRGILCHRCNVSIGLMDDDPDRIEAMLNYLKNNSNI